MSEVIGVLMVLAGSAFLLQVVLERVKNIFPFLGGTYTFNIGKVEFKIAPMQFISLACGIGLMFAINQPICLFAALGYAVPSWITYVVDGILISGGANFIYDIVHRIEKKDNTTAEE